MADNYHTSEVIEEIRDKLWADLKTGGSQSLDLKYCQRGSIEHMPTPDRLNEMTPVIFVKPIITEYAGRTLSENFTEIIAIRLVYVFNYSNAETMVTDKIDHAGKIVQSLVNNFNLTAISLTDAEMEYTKIRGIEYEPFEDAFVGEEVSAALAVLAINWEARVLTDR